MKPTFLTALPLAAALGVAPLNAQQVELHPSLRTAASKVDPGGSFVELNHVGGDIDVLTKYVNLFLEAVREFDDSVPEIDISKILDASGIGDINATARSNSWKDDIWLNQAYIDNGGSRDGVFSLLGGTGEEFSVPRMCPQGTDLAFEFPIDLSQMPHLIRSVAATVGAGEEAAAELDKEIAPLEMTIEQTLKKIDVTFNLAIDFDSLADADSVSPPAFVGRIDGLNWLWLKLGEQFIKDNLEDNEVGYKRTEEGGVVTYTLTDEGIEEELMGYNPVLVIDTKKDHLWLASSQEFLARSQKKGSQLIDDPAFKTTWEGLPEKGNAMAYVSSELLKNLRGLLDTAMAAIPDADEEFGPAMEGLTPVIDTLLNDLTKSKSGFAFSIANDNQGIHFATKLPFPDKYLDSLQQSLVGLAPLFLMGMSEMEAPEIFQ